jgi:cation:H+ antiporter
MSSALLIAAGLGGLLVGADLLVRGGAALASHLGVRPIVVGLTVVALGTSLPELAVGIDAVRQDSPGLAVGNIVGANLVNILFVLGLSALIRPIAFERRTLRFDLPAMTAAALALWLLARDGSLTRVDGVILGLGGAAYTAGIIWTSRPESAAVQADYASHSERTTPRGGRELLLRGAGRGSDPGRGGRSRPARARRRRPDHRARPSLRSANQPP